MTILKIKLIGAALLLVSSTAFAEANPDYFAVSGIPNTSSLTLRAWPSAGSQPINNIPSNTINIETTGKHIFKENKKWLQVMYQNSVGWVEADYLAIMQATAPPVISQPPAQEISEVASFSYSQPQNTPIKQQPIPDDIPWTPEQDTIYHDPTAQQLLGENPIETVQAKHTLVIIDKKNEEGDLRAENIAGNRYQSVEASMSVIYQP
ncbi:MAG: SH3 domain-containing protein [Leucothrix sp.]